MQDIKRCLHITLVKVKYLDLQTEQVIQEEIELPSWYRNYQIMVTKLNNLLQEENKKLIQVISHLKATKTYYMGEETFFKYSYHIVIEPWQTKNKNKNQKEN